MGFLSRSVRLAASVLAHRLHALHGITGKMRPDHGIARQLVGARSHHAGARTRVQVEIDLGDALHGIGGEVLQQDGVAQPLVTTGTYLKVRDFAATKVLVQLLLVLVLQNTINS